MRLIAHINPFAILFLALLFVACGDEEPTPAPVTPSVASNVAASPTATIPATATAIPQPTAIPSGTIVLWHSWAEGDGEALEAILTDFAEAQSAITVETLYVTENDLPQSYADAVLAGRGPDLVITANWWFNEMINAKIMQPLDNLVSPTALEVFLPAALTTLRRDGKLYGLPTYVESVSLLYNRSLIEEEALPQTTEEMLDLAQQSASYGTGIYANLYHIAWGFPAFGADLIGDTGKIELTRTVGAVEFLTWLKAVNDTPGSYVDPDYGMLIDRFKRQEFAFFVDGPWSVPDLQAALGADLGITLLPAGPQGQGQPWLSTGGLFLNPRTTPEQQQLAIQFALYLTNRQSGQHLLELAQRVPANRSVTIKDETLLAGFAKQAAAAQPLDTRPEMDNVWGYAGDMLTKVLTEVSQPAEAVAEAATLIDKANGK